MADARRRQKKKKSPEATLAAFVDESVPNLSSIVVLAELGGKSMLLTGDARGDKILEGLELVRPARSGRQAALSTCSRSPHHGSDNNVATGVLRARDGRPLRLLRRRRAWQSRSARRWRCCCEARGVDAPYTIHLTYPVDGNRHRASEGLGRGAGQGKGPQEEESEQQEAGKGGLVARQAEPGGASSRPIRSSARSCHGSMQDASRT